MRTFSGARPSPPSWRGACGEWPSWLRWAPQAAVNPRRSGWVSSRHYGAVEDHTKEVLARRIEREGDDGQPGATILISQDTYEQVRERVQVDPDIPPLQAKGKAEPIPVYRVLGLSGLEV